MSSRCIRSRALHASMPSTAIAASDAPVPAPANEVPVEWLLGASFKFCGWQYGAMPACASEQTGDAALVADHRKTSAALDEALADWLRDMETLRKGIITLWSKRFAGVR